MSKQEIWDLWIPDTAAQGISFARGRLARHYPCEAETASLPAWQYMIAQEFFRYRAEKTTYIKFETA